MVKILTQEVIFLERFANDEVYFTSAKSPLPLFAKEGIGSKVI